MNVLMLAALIVSGCTNRRPPPPPPATPKGNALVEDARSGVIYKLEIKDQERLMSAVARFCVREYDRDSCVHHLITCGTPCLVAVPKTSRPRIYLDYQRLRVERGLLPLPPRITALDAE